MDSMLRAVAILLVSLIGFGLIAPGALADSGAQLPPCCRAHGKHQCAMKMASLLDHRGDSSASAVGEKCPCFPKMWTSASNSQTYSPRAVQVFFCNVLSHASMQAQAEARYRISFSRSRQKRGPPSFLFS